MKIVVARLLTLICVGMVAASAAVSAENDVKIEYIAHASFRITSPDGTKIIIDPYASNVWIGYAYPENLEADAIVITHPHYDHDGGEYRGLASPWDTPPKKFRQIGDYTIGDIKLTGVPGKHAGPYGKEFGQKNIIWIIEVGGLRIAHLGDNGPITDQIKNAIGKVDILMLPADGDQHILKNEEAIAFIDALEPRVQIAMHYCLPELQPEGKCPGGLLPIAPPLRSDIKVNNISGNMMTISKGDLPNVSEYWIFEPSPAIVRQAVR